MKLILVDDGSTDGSVAKMRSRGEMTRPAFLFSIKNYGQTYPAAPAGKTIPGPIYCDHGRGPAERSSDITMILDIAKKGRLGTWWQAEDRTGQDGFVLRKFPQ